MAQHTVSPKLYVGIWAALVALTLTTTGVAFLDLGIFNTVVAITIAVLKTSLVVLVFMHVWYSSVRLTWVFMAAGVLWLVLLISLTVGDVVTRPWIPFPLPWTAVTGQP